MKSTGESKKPARMSDAAVQAKTGKVWAEWFKLLDAAGARTMNHKEIVAILRQEHGLGPWWQQLVTVGYEQERGMRALNERPDGYQIGHSKTFAVPIATLYAAWHDEKKRSRWLKDAKLVIRKATPDKSLRITWGDGTTDVDVMFYVKGDNKSQVTVNHGKLPDAAEAARMKAYWGAALDRLKQALDS